MIQLKGAGSMENVMGIPGVLNRPNASLSSRQLQEAASGSAPPQSSTRFTP